MSIDKGTAKFVPSEPKKTPNLPSPSASTPGYLEFSFSPAQAEDLRPIQIVDGQHRVFGASAYNDEDIPLLIVAILDADIQERAFQFVVINNKATRVPTDNVKAIIGNIDDDALRERLINSGVRYGTNAPYLLQAERSEDSPFRGLLDWPLNHGTFGSDKKLRFIALTTIESAMRYIHIALKFDDDEDSEQYVLFAIWTSISEYYRDLWAKESKESHNFMSKVSMLALHEVVVNRLASRWQDDLVDPYDAKSIGATVDLVIRKIPSGFWKAEWTTKLQDTTSFRNKIKDDLETMQANNKLGRPWFQDLECIIAPTQAPPKE